MEGRQDDQGSSYAFNGCRQSPQQLPAVVQPCGLPVSFVTDLLGHCGSLVAVPTKYGPRLSAGANICIFTKAFRLFPEPT
jgi:hypothetical protein